MLCDLLYANYTLMRKAQEKKFTILSKNTKKEYISQRCRRSWFRKRWHYRDVLQKHLQTRTQFALMEDTVFHRCYCSPHLQIWCHQNPQKNVCDTWYASSRTIGAAKGKNSQPTPGWKAMWDVRASGLPDTKAPYKVPGINPETHSGSADTGVEQRRFWRTRKERKGSRTTGYPSTQGKVTLDSRAPMTQKHEFHAEWDPRKTLHKAFERWQKRTSSWPPDGEGFWSGFEMQ